MAQSTLELLLQKVIVEELDGFCESPPLMSMFEIMDLIKAVAKLSIATGHAMKIYNCLRPHPHVYVFLAFLYCSVSSRE